MLSLLILVLRKIKFLKELQENEQKLMHLVPCLHFIMRVMRMMIRTSLWLLLFFYVRKILYFSEVNIP